MRLESLSPRVNSNLSAPGFYSEFRYGESSGILQSSVITRVDRRNGVFKNVCLAARLSFAQTVHHDRRKLVRLLASTMNPAGWSDVLEAAEQKDFEAVKYFVEKRNASVTTCNSENQTIAHLAVEKDNFKMLKYCIEKDRSVIKCRDNMMRNVLVRAVQKNALNMVSYLLEECKENIMKEHNIFFGLTIIHIAAHHGHLDLLKYFFTDLYMDCNIRNDAGEPPLFFAAENVHMPVVKYLVEEQRVNVLATDMNKDHVLYVSAWCGDLIVPRYLLDERRLKVDLDYRDQSGETLLHRAVQFNHLNFTKYLVEEKRVKKDVVDEEGKTPLHHAVAGDNLNVAKYLCEKGARTDIRDARGKTAFELSTDERTSKILKAFASKRFRRDVFAILPHSEDVDKITGTAALIGTGRTTFHDELFPFANGLLILANLYTKYFTISGYRKAKPWSPPLTVAQILENRMDPAAVEATETTFDFMKS